MKVEDVIKEVVNLQDELGDVDGLSEEHILCVDTNGDVWNVTFGGIILVSSEDDYNEEIPLKAQIIKKLKDIKEYLDVVLKGR